MEYNHRDGEDSADYVTVPSVGAVPVENGTFEVDAPESVHDRLVEVGHEPVGGTAESESVTLPENLTEDDVVAMEPQEIRSLASDVDDLDGRKSADELEEKIILKLREREDE